MSSLLRITTLKTTGATQAHVGLAVENCAPPDERGYTLTVTYPGGLTALGPFDSKELRLALASLADALESTQSTR